MAENGLQGGDRGQSVELIYGMDAAVAEFVRQRLNCGSFGSCDAIGISYKDKLIGGVVFYVYRGHSVEMAIATDSPVWCKKRILKAIFSYAFNVLGCERITVTVDAGNDEVRRFDERLGFIYEGTLKQGHPSGDCAIYRMLRDECKWL